MTDNGGEDRAGLADRVARAAMELCCRAYEVTIHEMTLKGRSRATAAYARQIAMYLAHVVGGLSLGEISAAFQRDRSTAAHACHTIEDRRDNPVFDGEIEELEQRYRYELARLRAVIAEEKHTLNANTAGKNRLR